MNTSYWRNKIMDDTFQSSSGNVFYVGISGTTPTAAGGNVTEPSGDGYARVKISAFTTAVDGQIENTNDIIFHRSNGVWFTDNAKCTHWVLFDGPGANAHLLSSGTLESPIAIPKNTVVTIGAGEITITLTDGVS